MPPQVKDYRHLIRAGILVLIVICAFVTARKFMVPSDFGKYGHYRASALDDIAAVTLKYAGAQSCPACHGKEASARSSSAHRAVSCENCHGPLAAHAANPKGGKPARPGKTREFCGRCHYKNASRPRAFPQVDGESHNPGMACAECHNPHSPKL